MGRGNHLVDMNEVYVRTEAAHKKQPSIHLWHLEEKFGGRTMQKKGRARTQHGVPTDHLASMDGLNIRRHQPRPRYAWVENKFVVESEPVNPYAGYEVQKEFPMA
jgi:hypothetical protein